MVRLTRPAPNCRDCHSTPSSHLDKDGLDPVDAAEVHRDVGEGLLLATPTRYSIQPEEKEIKKEIVVTVVRVLTHHRNMRRFILV